ncbi:hypothetical protein DMC30DRAFT_27171 [Rhodotorula diobovata]|uniref:Uncharacterized protein n=1 Tax=Rhodotorula diobovata TaxID=5288 RepID=A0A5C5FQ87_9BASI|nr:hypothetical protein DMC30DRAFT_27171 [Rhodotorula diobovata]
MSPSGFCQARTCTSHLSQSNEYRVDAGSLSEGCCKAHALNIQRLTAPARRGRDQAAGLAPHQASRLLYDRPHRQYTPLLVARRTRPSTRPSASAARARPNPPQSAPSDLSPTASTPPCQATTRLGLAPALRPSAAEPTTSTPTSTRARPRRRAGQRPSTRLNRRRRLASPPSSSSSSSNSSSNRCSRCSTSRMAPSRGNP